MSWHFSLADYLFGGCPRFGLRISHRFTNLKLNIGNSREKKENKKNCSSVWLV